MLLQNKSIASLLFLLIAMPLATYCGSITKPKQYDNLASIDTIPEPEPQFVKVDEDASFPGGESKWIAYLGSKLDGSVPASKGAPEGKYTVFILFYIDGEGKVSGIKPLTSQGFGMEEEAMRVIKSSPRWKPAMLNGKPVNGFRKQPIIFVVEQKKKRKRDRD